MANKYLYINPITKDLEESTETLVALEIDGSLPAVSAKNLIDLPSAGSSGKPADYFADVYRSDATLLPSELPINGTYDGSIEILPIGWFDDALAPIPGQYVWKSRKRYYTIKIGNNWVWQNDNLWSVPVKHVYIPTIGVDYSTTNTFTSYVFRKELIGVTPTAPVNGSWNGISETFPTLPVIWLDNPPSQAYNEVIWIVTRTYIKTNNGTWSAPSWSAPAVFSAKNNLSGHLTNDNFTAKANADGTSPDLVGAAGNFIVYFADVDVSNNCVYTISGTNPQSGLTIVIDTAGHYNVSGTWTSDSVSFDLVATYNINAASVLKTFTISKAKQGIQGNPGTPGQSILVQINSSNGNVFKNNTGTPKILTANIYIGGVLQTVTTGYVYIWTNDGFPIYVDVNNNYISNIQTGGLLLANGNTGVNIDNIIIGPEDVNFNSNLNIVCEVVGI